MIQRIVTPILLFIFLIIVPPFFYLFNYSQTVPSSEQNVVYELPYPGLLSDHPLYPLKSARDLILELLTRDNLKKAELRLMLSDKQIKSAELLAKMGKNSPAITALRKGERYFQDSVNDLKNAKTQGAAPTADVIDRMMRSNKKHALVIQQLFADFPQGEQAQLQTIQQLNQENTKNLSSVLQ